MMKSAAWLKTSSRASPVDEEHLAWTRSCNVGSGGNYLAEDHTFRHMRDLRVPLVSSRQGYSGAGEMPDTARRAQDIIVSGWPTLSAPALDPKVEAELLRYFEKLA
jgi:trimethylamine:corrinoid methyltransferase-like protein